MKSPKSSNDTSQHSTSPAPKRKDSISTAALNVDQAKKQPSALCARARRLERENTSLRARTADYETKMEDLQGLWQQHEWLHQQHQSLEEKHQSLNDQYVRVSSELTMMKIERQIRDARLDGLAMPALERE